MLMMLLLMLAACRYRAAPTQSHSNAECTTLNHLVTNCLSARLAKTHNTQRLHRACEEKKCLVGGYQAAVFDTETTGGHRRRQ